MPASTAGSFVGCFLLYEVLCNLHLGKVVRGTTDMRDFVVLAGALGFAIAMLGLGACGNGNSMKAVETPTLSTRSIPKSTTNTPAAKVATPETAAVAPVSKVWRSKLVYNSDESDNHVCSNTMVIVYTLSLSGDQFTINTGVGRPIVTVMQPDGSVDDYFNSAITKGVRFHIYGNALTKQLKVRLDGAKCFWDIVPTPEEP